MPTPSLPHLLRQRAPVWALAGFEVSLALDSVNVHRGEPPGTTHTPLGRQGPVRLSGVAIAVGQPGRSGGYGPRRGTWMAMKLLEQKTKEHVRREVAAQRPREIADELSRQNDL